MSETPTPLSLQEWLDPMRRAACFDDMLAALKAALRNIETMAPDSHDVLKTTLRAAIAKSESK